MSNHIYEVTKSKISIEGKEYFSYGIRVVDIKTNECMCVKDIFISSDRTASLCMLLRRNDVDMVHVMDIVNDSLLE